ncbi:sigma-54-dependent Fis family transcriptional regulator [Spiribacter sp. 227]|uniref:Sigma-54-dependent Fis family transcriptional regulator n=1 Tax=Spiribacter onubensis TaxID=3122420 RepID=A0ABV3S7K3_9GAMM
MQSGNHAHARRVEESVRRWSAHSATRVIRPEDVRVAISWRRSLINHSLDPGRSGIEIVLDEAHLRRRRERLGELYPIAEAEMENLYRHITGSGYSVLLTDAEGYILNRLGDPGLEEDFERAGLWPGADWSESTVGTNGIGTCIAESRAVTIHRDEHFLSRNTNLSCSAAPIRDPHGRLLAVLDVSSAHADDTRESQLHTIALVRTSARIIESIYFLNSFRDQFILRFHERASMVDLPHAGMLAIDGEGGILAINDSAREQFGIQCSEAAINTPVEEFFGITGTSLHEQASIQSDILWRIRDVRSGKQVFASLRRPLVKNPAGAVSQSVAGSPLFGECGEAGELTLDLMARNADPKVVQSVRCARRVMDRNVPIVLCGETGTGKEVLARAIHNASLRQRHPFVAVNCASIPESLIESELFGYRHGAFTGAKREGMRGKVLESSGGTLFLDEIGDMPPELQTRLLRVLEQKEVLPLGSEAPVPVELNVISATHRQLPRLVQDGIFREDLYYRLNGITLSLPALREREDKDRVIRAALAAESGGNEEVAIDEAAFQRLLHYPWPGNVRQLRNCLRTALALCDGGIIRLRDLPQDILEADIPPASGTTADALDPTVHNPAEASTSTAGSPLEAAEKDTLLRELQQHRWNITRTAASLGVSRNTLYRKLNKYGIDTGH